MEEHPEAREDRKSGRSSWRFFVAPSCVWWQVVGDLFAGGFVCGFERGRVDERGWKQKFGFMFISEEIG